MFVDVINVSNIQLFWFRQMVCYNTEKVVDFHPIKCTKYVLKAFHGLYHMATIVIHHYQVMKQIDLSHYGQGKYRVVRLLYMHKQYFMHIDDLIMVYHKYHSFDWTAWKYPDFYNTLNQWTPLAVTTPWLRQKRRKNPKELLTCTEYIYSYSQQPFQNRID